MNRLLDSPTTVQGPSPVSFVPFPSGPRHASIKKVEFTHLPLLHHIQAELGPKLVDLARRTQRLGPISGGTVVLLTGCRRGVGCTTVALSMAAAAAGADQSVLLIDADLCHPGLAALGDMRPLVGWEKSLLGEYSLEKSLVSFNSDSPLKCLPLVQPIVNVNEVFQNASMPQWVSQLRREFSLIVLDGGSVWDSGSAWAKWADVALVVCDAGKTLAEDWSRAWDRLEEGGTHVLGIIESLG